MERYFGSLTIVLLFAMVWTRVLILKSKGIQAMNFGKTDKTDFLILPFVFLYFYLVFAAEFALPSITRQRFFHSHIFSWAGVACCLAGLIFLFSSLVSFGKSFRVGVDQDHPGILVTTGIFAISRNPIYVAFAFVLAGEFLLFPNWILLAYLVAAVWLFNRQVSREEQYLSEHYGQQYTQYCRHVRRYL